MAQSNHDVQDVRGPNDSVSILTDSDWDLLNGQWTAVPAVPAAAAAASVGPAQDPSPARKRRRLAGIFPNGSANHVAVHHEDEDQDQDQDGQDQDDQGYQDDILADNIFAHDVIDLSNDEVPFPFPVRLPVLSESKSDAASAASSKAESKAVSIRTETALSISAVNEECTICSDPLLLTDPKLDACGHRFHGGCIMKWFNSRARTCPICRAYQPTKNDPLAQFCADEAAAIKSGQGDPEILAFLRLEAKQLEQARRNQDRDFEVKQQQLAQQERLNSRPRVPWREYEFMHEGKVRVRWRQMGNTLYPNMRYNQGNRAYVNSRFCHGWNATRRVRCKCKKAHGHFCGRHCPDYGYVALGSRRPNHNLPTDAELASMIHWED